MGPLYFGILSHSLCHSNFPRVAVLGDFILSFHFSGLFGLIWPLFRPYFQKMQRAFSRRQRKFELFSIFYYRFGLLLRIIKRTPHPMKGNIQILKWRPVTHVCLGLLVWLFSFSVVMAQGKETHANRLRGISESGRGVPLTWLGKPFSGTAFHLYENGQRRWTATFKSGKREGPSDWYYRNGQLRRKENWQDGRLDGVVETYYSTGQLQSKKNYKEGRLEGSVEIYARSGQVTARRNYSEGRLEGSFEVYSATNQLLTKGSYKDGKKDGVWEYYHDTGKPKRKETYKGGKLTSEENY